MTDSTPPEAELLATYRRTLRHLLGQAAAHGGERFAPPEVAAGIAQARVEIARLKQALQTLGVATRDEVIDTPTPEASGEVPAPQQRGPGQISISISGGTVGGPVIANTGTMTTIYGTPNLDAQAPATLEQALGRVRAVQSAARERGDDDTADDLQPVLLALEAADKARAANKHERYARKLAEARDDLDSLAANPEITPIVQLLTTLVAAQASNT